MRAAGQDIRAYYEEAGLALSDHVPAARQLESWFYQQTQTGPIVRAAAAALEAAGEDRKTWYYMLPGNHRADPAVATSITWPPASSSPSRRSPRTPRSPG